MNRDFFLFATLNALVLGASIAIANRMRLSGRAETALAAAMLWAAGITLPILGLGWVNELHRPLLAGVVALLATVSGAIALLAGKGIAERWRQLHWSFLRLARLPLDALVITARARSVSFLAVAFALLVLMYTAWLAWILPATSWDGLWYHQPIVGYALQNHGFSLVHVPAELEYVNGFPKVCEMMNLWFVIFTGRRLIELPNTVMAVPLLLGVFVLLRRWLDDAAAAVGWSCSILLLPCFAFELRSTYIDVHVAALTIAALVFVTRPELRLRDVALTTLTLGLLLGSKGTTLIVVAVFGAIVAFRLLRDGRLTWVARVGSIAGLAAGTFVIGAPTYLRNWILHGNPLWPIWLHIPALHIVLRGGDALSINEITNQNVPWTQFQGYVFTRFHIGEQLPDLREGGYGPLITTVVVPIAAAALTAAIVGTIRRRRARHPADRRVANLLLTCLPVLATLVFTPALWWARFNLVPVIAVVTLAAWGLETAAQTMSRVLLAALILSSGLILIRGRPGWGATWSEAWTLAKESPADRAASSNMPWAPATAVAKARDRELGAGDVIAYSEDKFVGLLWNSEMSNRVEYVPPAANRTLWFHLLDGMHAQWVVVSTDSPALQWLQANAAWSRVGFMAGNEPQWIAFRHSRAPEGPSIPKPSPAPRGNPWHFRIPRLPSHPRI